MPLNPAKLKELRTLCGLTQAEAAARAGVEDRARWCRLEAGQVADPRLSTLEGIASAFGVDVGELLTRAGPSSKTTPTATRKGSRTGTPAAGRGETAGERVTTPRKRQKPGR